MDADPEDFEIKARLRYSAFLDLLADAAFQHRLAEAHSEPYGQNRHARASVLASALSVECAANCLTEVLNVGATLLKDIEKMTALGKIEVFLAMTSKRPLDRGSIQVQPAVELVKLRNDYVHPKVYDIDSGMHQMRESDTEWMLPFTVRPKMWPHLGISKTPLFWGPACAASVLRALAEFYRYLFVDLLAMDEDDVICALPSRFTSGKLHIPAITEEVSRELLTTTAPGVDFSFFSFLANVPPAPSGN